jgi:hypothetical protein
MLAAVFVAGGAYAATPPAAEAPPTGEPAAAAPQAAAATPVTPVTSAAACCRIAAGTPVTIEIAEPISTKTVKQGDTFAIRLAEPLSFEGRVVVPAGATGVGQVVDAGRAGIGGKPAKLVLAARYFEHDGKQWRLRGLKFGGAGTDRANTAMALSLAVGVVGILVHGGEIDIAPGTRADAKLAEDLPVPAVDAKPAPTPASAPADPSKT